MDLQDMFAKLKNEKITVIEEVINVQYDNGQQTPLGFQWRGRHYEVLKRLHVSQNPGGRPQYLLLTDGGIFALALHRDTDSFGLCQSKWVLSYRISDEQEQNSDTFVFASRSSVEKERLLFAKGTADVTLAPLLLANAAHYHGHLCPELAIGYRAAQIAEEELGLSRNNAYQFFIIAENMSSAIESLQLITGCTIGNQNFFAYDLGKHVYYFGNFSNAHESKKALRLALTNLVVDLSHKRDLEKRIISGQADLKEQEDYRQFVGNKVQEILRIPARELFATTRIALLPPKTSGRQDYICCSCCGEVTALGKCNPIEKGFLCRVCSANSR